MTAWLAMLALAMILAHMAQPRFKRRRLSAASFFAELRPAKRAQSKWVFARPPLNRAFLLRMLVFVPLFCAVIPSLRPTHGQPVPDRIGIWLIVDTSGSMTTAEGARMAAAKQEARTILEKIEKRAEGQPMCFRLSTFDAAFTDVALLESPRQALNRIVALHARPLATDLGLLRDTIELNLEKNVLPECPLTQVVVLSDQPAPIWVNELPSMVWRHVGEAAPNVGLIAIRAGGNPITGEVKRVHIVVRNWQGNLTPMLRVLGPGNRTMVEKPVSWEAGKTWHTSFQPEQSGLYKLGLEPGGAYRLDDEAVISIRRRQPLVVQWELDDVRIPELLGWDTQSEAALLRVATTDGSKLPTIILGDTEGITETGPITGFVESDPLLRNLNFDVVERTPLPSLPPPEGFKPILRSSNRAWIARRADPPAIYLASLPDLGESGGEDPRTLWFFNAVFDLVGADGFAPLYTLTNPRQPTIADGRLALHPGEGDTSNQPRSLGEIGELKLLPGSRLQLKPSWPLWLFLAVLLLTSERCLSAWRGAAWR